MKHSKKEEEPPFRYSEVRYSYGQDGGHHLVVQRQRRGFLTDEVVRVEPPLAKPLKPDPKVLLSELQKDLRAELDEKELPTDEWPVTPIELDWGYDPKEHGYIADEDLWIGVLEDSTEPLTKHRIAGDLLHTLSRLSKRPGVDEHLHDFYRAMRLYALYRIAGELNSLALAGQVAREVRAKGPRRKNADTRELRAIITKLANILWAQRPHYRGHSGKTAAVIVDEVNRIRRTLHPGCKAKAKKTIADHLSAMMREAKKAAR